MARVLTRSDGSECIVIEEEDGGVKVLRLTRPAPAAIDPKRYRVNGEIWRATNPNSHWAREVGSLEEAVWSYRQPVEEWEEGPLASLEGPFQ